MKDIFCRKQQITKRRVTILKRKRQNNFCFFFAYFFTFILLYIFCSPHGNQFPPLNKKLKKVTKTFYHNCEFPSRNNFSKLWVKKIVSWSKASKTQRESMLVEEVTWVEQERFHIKAVSLGQQGAWTRWGDTVNKHISWADIWITQQDRLSFQIWVVYDTLLCPLNLTWWFGDEVGWSLCGNTRASL